MRQEMGTGIGETLQRARREQDVSLSEAAAATRVREAHLAAIEEDDFAAMGGDIYVKGFVRSYARFLNVDPEPLLEWYREHHEREQHPTGLAGTPLSAVPRQRPPAVGIVAALALTGLVGLATIGFFSDAPEPAADQRVVPPPVEQTTPPPVTAEPTPTATRPSVLSLEGEVELELSVAGGRSWVRALVDGRRRVEGLQEDGFTRTFTGQEQVSVRIGDASVATIAVNGVDLGELGGPGDVVEVTCAVGASDCRVEPG